MSSDRRVGAGSWSSPAGPKSIRQHGECLLAGRRGRVHRGVHGPTRRQHRHRRPAHAAADLPRQRRCGHLGGPELPLGPGGHGDRRRPFRRHVGSQAPLRLRVRRLRDRLSTVRPCSESRRPHRVPGRSRRSVPPCSRPTAWPSSSSPCPGVTGQGDRDPGSRPGHRARPRPSVGGLLLAVGGWRLIFMVNVPFGVLGVIAGLLLIPRSLQLRPGCLSTGRGCPCSSRPSWPCSRPSRSGTHTAGLRRSSSGSSASGLPLAVAFVDWERTCRDPMLDLRLFRGPRFDGGITSGLLSYLVMFGCAFPCAFLFRAGAGDRCGAGRPRAHDDAAGPRRRRAVRRSPGGSPRGTAAHRRGDVAGGDRAPCPRCPAPCSAWISSPFWPSSEFGLGFFTPSNNAAIMGSAPEGQSGMAQACST